MDKDEIIRKLKENGISVVDLGGEVYEVTFDDKYTPVIRKNLNTYGLEHFLISARNRATFEGIVASFISPPSGRLISPSPYKFEITAPFIIVVFFIQRIVIDEE